MNNEKVTPSTQEKSDDKLRIDFHEPNSFTLIENNFRFLR